MRFLILFLFILASINVNAQLGFCKGSKGDPIFHEDFGNGSGTGPKLADGLTNYTYVRQDPYDGEYTVADNISRRINSWHSYLPNTTVSNGRALIVNADYTAGQFYRTKISGLCQNTTYEFSAYLMNIYNSTSNACENGGIPVNVRFEIWNETETFLIKEGNTGNINSTSTPKWEQYALTFRSGVGEENVVLKMFNNGEGGCGNDLAIDDIIFRSCGDLTIISSPEFPDDLLKLCEEETPVTLSLDATPDNSVYSDHFYQWQKSSDGEYWNDITNANTSEYITSPIFSTSFYRVKVAEDPANLKSNYCSSASDPFEVRIISRPLAPPSNGDIEICDVDAIPSLSVLENEDVIINWYTEPTGGTSIATGESFTPTTAGTFYAEAKNIEFDCGASERTAVTLNIFETPKPENEELQICLDTGLILNAGFSGMSYIWSTGEKTQQINISEPGNFYVDITTGNGCSARKEYTVSGVDIPEIIGVTSNDYNVTITPSFSGAFEYSLDGKNFQESNEFQSIQPGVYMAYMRDLQGCKTVFLEFPHIVIPSYITPNNDGFNDDFRLNGISYYESSEIRIFDRYGKLIRMGNGNGFSWDGSFNGLDLPASDYWYEIQIEGYKMIKGHFSLIRNR